MVLRSAVLSVLLALTAGVTPLANAAQPIMPAAGGITRLEITRVESPTFDGHAFGNVGQYVKLVGRAYGEVDPNDPRNAVITDLSLAPRNSSGMVEYVTDVFILKPLDPSKSNHRLFFDVNNRGDMRALSSMDNAATGGNDPTAANDSGNGFLLEQGYTIVSAGWDATVLPGNGRLTITVPVAKNADGSTITGPALEELVVDDTTTVTLPLTYAAASPDKSNANLTVRVRYEDPPMPVPAQGWAFTDDTLKTVSLAPNGTAFQQGRLYEFTYTARDPLVAGLGFAALRDVATFLHRGTLDDQGNPNPLAGDVQFIYTFCSSQPCRTMHDYLWLGFNQDEAGLRVFDGVLNWVGGGDGIFMNYRFAQPGRTHRQHIARWYPEYQFPFANQVLLDPVTGKSDGRLRRCGDTGTCPQIFEVNSENEYWAKAMSVFQLDGEGNDLADPANVRYFLMSSLPHGAGSGPGICQQNRNPLGPNPVLRALLVDLDQWVTSGTEPPPSRMPRRADGTLVPSSPQDVVGFPAIPGVIYNGRNHTGDLFDFGPQFDKGILSIVPPTLLGTPYPALVPRTDSDGNDLAGIRLPDVAAPLATYSGWNLRAVPSGANDGCDASGQKIDFTQTQAERLAKGDPRPSIEERYPTHDTYVNAVTQAATDLQQQRLLLDQDVQQYIQAAEQSPIGR
jgi:alpha/beta hydrolase family protein